jgi:opacity protein-like surface antigen
MRKAVIALAALTALSAPAASRAEEQGLNLRLGVGLGYSIPFGDARKGEKLADVAAGEVPLELEVSYRFTHAISAGVYGGYGYGLVSSSTVNGVRASDEIDSISTWRLGVQGEYEFGKIGPALPYAGLRVGYVTESVSQKNGGGTATASGWEYLTVLAGADFEVSKGLAVGPFASFALGQYTTQKPAGGSSASIPSDEQAMHQWLTIGVRGAFGF